VWVGEEHWEAGVWAVNDVTFGDESFVGNSGCVAAGHIPNNSVVASLAVVDGSRGECYSLAFGNPVIWTKYGSDRSSLAFTTATKDYNRCLRVVAEIFIFLVLMITMATEFLVGFVVGYVCYLYNFNWVSIMLLYRATGVVYGLLTGLLVKVLFIGKYKACKEEMFSRYYYRNRLISVLSPGTFQTDISFWDSSAIMNAILRCFGVRIGKRSVVPSMGCTEWDLVSIGDDCIIEDNGFIQPHTMDGRVLKLYPVTVEDNVLVGSGSLLLAGCTVQQDSHIESLTLVIPHQVVPTGSLLVGGAAGNMEMLTPHPV